MVQLAPEDVENEQRIRTHGDERREDGAEVLRDGLQVRVGALIQGEAWGDVDYKDGPEAGRVLQEVKVLRGVGYFFGHGYDEQNESRSFAEAEWGEAWGSSLLVGGWDDRGAIEDLFLRSVACVDFRGRDGDVAGNGNSSVDFFDGTERVVVGFLASPCGLCCHC